MSKNNSNEKKPLGFGNTQRRFTQTDRHKKGSLAKDRFAFDQAMQGHDCTKMRRGGDFVVQKRDFFGEKEGESAVMDVKVGDAKLTEAQEQRKRRLRGRYKIARY